MDSNGHKHMLKELKQPILGKILKYKTKWLYHADTQVSQIIEKLQT